MSMIMSCFGCVLTILCGAFVGTSLAASNYDWKSTPTIGAAIRGDCTDGLKTKVEERYATFPYFLVIQAIQLQGFFLYMHTS